MEYSGHWVVSKTTSTSEISKSTQQVPTTISHHTASLLPKNGNYSIRLSISCFSESNSKLLNSIIFRLDLPSEGYQGINWEYDWTEMLIRQRYHFVDYIIHIQLYIPPCWSRMTYTYHFVGQNYWLLLIFVSMHFRKQWNLFQSCCKRFQY